MSRYGGGPAIDEIEVTLFGPGYGEALAVHLGDGNWILVDSCMDPIARLPAAVAYLDDIGVEPVSVRGVVASHWHDDHVRGLSEVVAKYPAAEFFLSAVFNDNEAATFVAAYNGVSSGNLSRGTRELYNAIVGASRRWVPTLSRTTVFEMTIRGRRVRVTALSPLPSTFAVSTARLSQQSPTVDAPMRNATTLKPNIEAVVLHIDLGDDALLLGADLEDHHAMGWSGLVADTWAGTRLPASAYKVAHHGSLTGECAGIWGKLLGKDPICCLTPFSNGRVRLPTDDDKSRLKSNSSAVYTSSGSSRRPNMDTRILKRLGDVCKNIAVADSGFGAVRLRKRPNEGAWRAELFGTAQQI